MNKAVTLLFLVVLIGVLLKVVLPFMDSSPYEITEDANGVPIVDYGWLMGKHVGKQRYPVTIAARGDKYYSYYLETGNKEFLEKFLNIVGWLEENKLEVDNAIVFPAEFPYPFYGCEKGWSSAMAQGFAIKNFLNAYNVTGDSRYMELASKSVSAYGIEVSDGGLLYVDPSDNGYWYAEYGCGTPPRVLNGFWYALDGLYYYHIETGDSEAKELYDRGVLELKKHLKEFDTGEWTYYDLERYPSTENYHDLHVEIMQKLYLETNESIFLEYRNKWEKYEYSEKRFNIMLNRNLVKKYFRI